MNNLTSLTCKADWPADAIPREWIEKLFKEMLLSYGKRFEDQWSGVGLEDMKRHWAQRMGELTGEEMKRGVMKMREKDWPPTLNEFLKLCKPSIDPTVAYYEAVNGLQAREKGEVGTWSHPAIFWAAVAVSAHDLKNQTYSQIKQRWERALQEEMEKGQWEPVPAPLVALPAPGMTKTDRETAAKRMNELQAQSGAKLADKTDHRAWIKKILDRQKRGDTTLPSIAVRFAKEALASKDTE